MSALQVVKVNNDTPKLADIPREQVHQTLSGLATKQSDTGYGARKFYRTEIKDWWVQGFINDAAYVLFAVQFMRGEEKSFTFDVPEFCQDWAVETGEGKEKILSESAVEKIISTWKKKGAIVVPPAPIQMDLFF